MAWEIISSVLISILWYVIGYYSGKQELKSLEAKIKILPNSPIMKKMRAFSYSEKAKPKINDDESAWRKEFDA